MAVWFILAINSTTSIESMADFDVYSREVIFVMITQALCYWACGLYRGVWRFASLPDLIRIIKANLIATVILISGYQLLNPEVHITYYIFPVFCILTISLLSGSRITYRWYKDNRKTFRNAKNVLVVGAGIAGESILRELQRKSNKDYCPIGLIDDDSKKLGEEIHGIRVLGNTNELPQIVKKKRVELVLIAMPTASTAQMRRVVGICEDAKVEYRTLPHLNDLASGKASITNMRHVSVEDLLSRDPIQFNREKLEQFINSKIILITGAGGSIGSELCRKIAENNPGQLILVEHSEFNLFQIHSELHNKFPHISIFPHLLSVTNEQAINQLMADYKPDYVFHAAAYKHVPLLEPQIRAAIENNIRGTEIVAQAAVINHVKKFILVSTDKAVNPCNVMGATKRCAEMICQSLNQHNITKFITVRFGNVLGSTGSVIPIFKEQIAKGGPVTVTHPDMERYFMTIQEAAQLIIQTVTIQNPSDLYVLDMGEPVKIQYLAEQMIKLSGQRPNIDIKIAYTGLRPGEKLYEELFYAHENTSPSEHEKIIRVDIDNVDAQFFKEQWQKFKNNSNQNDDLLKKYLFNLVQVSEAEARIVS